MSDNEDEEKLTTRGLPEHEKGSVRREQNRRCVQRFREKRREEYRQLCENHIASEIQIRQIEKRIEALVKILEDAGVKVPPFTANLVRQSLAAAFSSIEGNDQDDDDVPDNEQLFAEIMQVLDDAED